MERNLKVDYPGLIEETLPSGNKRYRVRVEGNKRRRIKLHVTPEHEKFREHYNAARRGIELESDQPPEEAAIRGSISWLTYKHTAVLEKQVRDGQLRSLTLKKRLGLMQRLRDEYGEYALKMPPEKVVALRDKMAGTPASADSMVEAISAMYAWAIEQKIVKINPAAGVPKIDKGRGGAKPWTVNDLRRYRERHPKGTQAHLALTLFMFTACRISDAIWLGRDNEEVIQGVPAISWQPTKKGSAFVQIPVMPQLHEATRAVKIVGPGPYLRKANGRVYTTPDQLGQRFRKWCRQAGLQNRSSHGIRKAAGHLLALEGCTQYQIMCIHGHTSPKTSEVYTKGVERWAMAREAMNKLAGMEW